MSSGKETIAQASNTGETGQSQSTWVPNESTQDLYGYLAGQTNQLMQEAVPYYSGQTYVSPSSLTQQGVSYGQEGVNTGQQAINSMYPVLNTAQSNYDYLSNAADVANNPYVQEMMKQNAQTSSDWLTQKALPALQSGSINVNALGSDRLGLAQGTAVEEAQKNLLAQNAATQMDAYKQGLGAQQEALGYTENMLSNYMQPSNTMEELAQRLGGYGQTVEGYQQKAIDDAMERYAYQYQEPWTRLQQAQDTLGSLSNLGTQYGATAGTGAGYSTEDNPNYKSAGQNVGALVSGIIGAILSAKASGGGAS